MPCSRRCGRCILARASSTPMPRPRRASPLPSTTARPAFPRPGSKAKAPCGCGSSTARCSCARIARHCAFSAPSAPALADEEGFVDTGDMVERRGDRLFFSVGAAESSMSAAPRCIPRRWRRRSTRIAAVRASRVFARTNAITGALVVADVVLRDGHASEAGLEREILAACRARLPAHMTPARLRFVADLPMTGAGKLVRHG